jgi:signal transduction histidine kinase
LRRAQREQTLEAASIAPSLVAIDADVDRMIALIDELIDAAHVRAGRALELRLTTTDLVALARACVTDFQTRATQPITLEAAAPTLVGSWDGSRLQRVLQNLLDNAVKYSPPNSRIAVRVSREDGLEGTGWAVLSVQDAGVGIPAADQPHIFERFRRGSNVGNSIGAGIGFGRSQADRQAARWYDPGRERGRGRQHVYRSTSARSAMSTGPGIGGAAVGVSVPVSTG